MIAVEFKSNSWKTNVRRRRILKYISKTNKYKGKIRVTNVLTDFLNIIFEIPCLSISKIQIVAHV